MSTWVPSPHHDLGNTTAGTLTPPLTALLPGRRRGRRAPQRGAQEMLADLHSHQPQCFLATRSTLRPRHTAVLPAVTPSLNLTFGEGWGLENAEMRVYFSPISKTQISTLLGFSLPIPHVKRIASGCGTVSILWFLIAVRAEPCTQIGQAQFLSKDNFL